MDAANDGPFVNAAPVERTGENVPPPLCVIGLGSSHGDDRAGWEVVARLRQMNDLGAPVEFRCVANAIDVLALLRGPQAVWIVDACENDTNCAASARYRWPTDSLLACRTHSTHGLTLPEVLTMADVLGQLPDYTVIYAVCGSNWMEMSPMGPKVAEMVSVVAGRIATEVRKWRQTHA